MTLSTDLEIKKKTSRLYELCARLFGDEFKGMFVAPREEFRSWLNQKTGCDVYHIVNLRDALDTWLEVLEDMNKAR